MEMARVRPAANAWVAIVEALRRVGLGTDRLERLQRSIDRLHTEIGEVSQDLDLDAFVAAGVVRESESASKARLRRAHHATRGTSTFASRAKFLIHLVTRSRRNPEQADVTVLQLMDSLERQIPGPVVRVVACEASSAQLTAALPAGADLSKVLGREGPLPPLFAELSSPGLIGSELHATSSDGRPAFGFGERDPRRTGPLRIACGEWIPSLGPIHVPREARSESEAAVPSQVQLVMPIYAWMEFAVCEVLWHRDVPHGGPPVASTHVGRVGESLDMLGSSPAIDVLGSFERCPSTTLPEVLRSATPTYRGLLQKAFDFLGEPYEAFEHWRYLVECPPMRSTLLVRRPLAERSELAGQDAGV